MITDRTISPNIAALTDRGLQRRRNEDAALAEVLPGGAVLLAVADGVGGAHSGDVASAETIAVLRDELGRAPPGDPARALRRAFNKANERVRALGATDSRSGMATTLVAAVISEGRAWIAHAGDSRASLVENGHLRQLTRDHSLVAEQVMAGVLTDDEAEHSNYRNVITRAIGIEDRVEPDIGGPIDLPPRSTLLLYSDGLYRVVSEEVTADAASASSAQAIAEALIGMANRAGGPDNISVAIYGCADE